MTQSASDVNIKSTSSVILRTDDLKCEGQLYNLQVAAVMLVYNVYELVDKAIDNDF